MPGAGRQVGMVQVIGLDPHRDEAAEQCFEHRRVIIDAAQQDALRQHRDPGPHQPADRRAHRRRQFARMVGVDHHINRLVGRQCRDEGGADPPRLGDRHAAVKADHREMRDRLEPANDRSDAARRQQQRVAAGDDDLPDLGMRGDVIEGAAERRRLEQPVAPADLLAAEADRADQDRLQQHPVRVAMDQAGQRRPALVADRVGPVVGRGVELGGPRHELRRDRVDRVGRIDQRRHLVGQRDGKFLGDPAQFLRPLRRDEAAF